MITVYELERRVPSYYGLCGLKTERAVYVRSHMYSPFFYMVDNLSPLIDYGWRVVKERDFPTKLKTGGFTRRIK